MLGNQSEKSGSSIKLVALLLNRWVEVQEMTQQLTSSICNNSNSSNSSCKTISNNYHLQEETLFTSNMLNTAASQFYPLLSNNISHPFSNTSNSNSSSNSKMTVITITTSQQPRDQVIINNFHKNSHSSLVVILEDSLQPCYFPQASKNSNCMAEAGTICIISPM